MGYPFKENVNYISYKKNGITYIDKISLLEHDIPSSQNIIVEKSYYVRNKKIKELEF